MPRVSKRVVDALKQGEVIWDSELKGFGARRRGTRVSYVLKYRVGRGRTARSRWYLIGHHGAPWTPAAAREQANRLLLRVRQGADPAAERDADQRAETFTDLWNEYRLRHSLPSKKQRTIAEDDALARAYVLPAFGSRKVRDLTRADVERWHSRLSHKPVRANRALALLKAMLNRGEAWGLREEGSNPAAKVRKFKEQARDRYLNAIELRVLAETLTDFEARNLCPPAATGLIRLLVLTGMRLNEALTLKWSYIDASRTAIMLPDSKTGPKSIPLPAPAQRVLAQQVRSDGVELVFPGRTPGKPLQGIQKIWQRIRTAAALTDVRIHDLRHGYASVAVQAGESIYLVGKILGHKQGSTTERYAHLTADPVLSVAEKTASRIEAFMAGHSAEVLSLNARR